MRPDPHPNLAPQLRAARGHHEPSQSAPVTGSARLTGRPFSTNRALGIYRPRLGHHKILHGARRPAPPQTSGPCQVPREWDCKEPVREGAAG
jgi:hypothetical protein